MSAKPFKWEGFDRLKRALDRIPKELEKKKLEEALVAAAEPIRDAMESLATRSQGSGHGRQSGRHMADAIKAEVVKGARPGEAKVAIGPATPGGGEDEFFYSLFIERGTSRVPARPFMRPAFDQTRDQALAIIEQVFVDAVEKAARA